MNLRSAFVLSTFVSGALAQPTIAPIAPVASPIGAPIVPTTEAPAMTSAPVLSCYLGQCPPCAVCGEGFVVGNKGQTINDPNNAAGFYTCGYIEKIGLDGFITPEQCTPGLAAGLQDQGCECTSVTDASFMPAAPVTAPAGAPAGGSAPKKKEEKEKKEKKKVKNKKKDKE